MQKKENRERMDRVVNLRRAALRTEFASIGLTLGQGQGEPRSLRALRANGAMTQRALADACFLEPTTLSRTLDRMESAGFLARRPHPDSRRAFLIDLTPLGQEKADAVCARLAVRDEELLAGFSEEELEWLRDALRRMNDNLERNTR